MTSHLRQNLHNHTRFSDGRHTAAQLIEEARRHLLTGLGVSDHFFTRKVYRRTDLSEWCRSALPAYLQMADEARRQAPGEVKVWWGLEIDSCFERIGTDLAGLPWPALNRLDYLLFEYVGEPGHGGMPFERLYELSHHCRIPVILAHPDPTQWEETLPIDRAFAIVRECGVALEIPGGRRNPRRWGPNDVARLAGVPLAIGCDTHESIADVGAIDGVVQFLVDHGLVGQVTDPERLGPPRGGNE